MATAHAPVIVVSGLPRSGTSMVMQMLEAGGVPIVTDRTRAADADNPRGYYELEAVKRLRKDSAWLRDAAGKAVKVIHLLLYDLPREYEYDVLFIRRPMPEVLASQRQMIERLGKAPAASDDANLSRIFAEQLTKVETWLAGQSNFRVLYLDHPAVLAEPLTQAKAIAAFLGRTMNVEAMARVVDPSLHRQRIGGEA